MKILSWRGPRGWSRWHLVSIAPGDETLCHLPVPDFAEMMLNGPTEPDDDRVCLPCRERYGISAAVGKTLALIEEYQPPKTWRHRVPRWAIALAPVAAVLLFDIVFTHSGVELWRDVIGIAAVGGGGTGAVVAIQAAVRRFLSS